MKKEIQVVMLPTKKASKIGKYQDTDNLVYNDGTDIPRGEFQHLYFLSDEEIEEGDWIYDTITKKIEIAKYNHDVLKRDWKKIIATTNETLRIKEVLDEEDPIYKFYPRPSNEFIKKYCELGGIDKVLVEYEQFLINPYTEKEVTTFDTIAAEDLESDYKLKVAPDGTISIYPFNTENYTKKEVIKILDNFLITLWKEVGIHYPISLGKDAKDIFINHEL